ncbi:hypothetical protein PYCC9005_005122 [Savitreella phatthalungensis]
MVHADASDFAQVLGNKDAVYAQILEECTALLEGQRNWVCNLANAACLLWHGLKSLDRPSGAVNWAGFYVIDHRDSTQLILGPFHGKVACQVIKLGRGVCGQAASMAKSTLVKDVHAHPDHIACDSETNSELVVPIIRTSDRKVVGVVDIDCADKEGFDEGDKDAIEKLARLLADACDWDV